MFMHYSDIVNKVLGVLNVYMWCLLSMIYVQLQIEKVSRHLIFSRICWNFTYKFQIHSEQKGVCFSLMNSMFLCYIEKGMLNILLSIFSVIQKM